MLDRLQADLKSAMLAKDAERTGVGQAGRLSQEVLEEVGG